MGWGSRCPSDGGRSPRGARRRDTAPFAGRCRSHPHHLGLIGGHQGLDRHPWLGHARGGTVLRPPQRERAAAEGPPGGLKAPRAERSLAGARQAEGRQCLGGAGVKDIHHPQGKAWLLLAPRGHGDPPPAGSMVGGSSQTRSVPVSPSHPGNNPSAEGRGPAEDSQLVGRVRGGAAGPEAWVREGCEGCEGGAWPWEASSHL